MRRPDYRTVRHGRGNFALVLSVRVTVGQDHLWTGGSHRHQRAPEDVAVRLIAPAHRDVRHGNADAIGLGLTKGCSHHPLSHGHPSIGQIGEEQLFAVVYLG